MVTVTCLSASVESSFSSARGIADVFSEIVCGKDTAPRGRTEEGQESVPSVYRHKHVGTAVLVFSAPHVYLASRRVVSFDLDLERSQGLCTVRGAKAFLSQALVLEALRASTAPPLEAWLLCDFVEPSRLVSTIHPFIHAHEIVRGPCAKYVPGQAVRALGEAVARLLLTAGDAGQFRCLIRVSRACIPALLLSRPVPQGCAIWH